MSIIFQRPEFRKARTTLGHCIQYILDVKHVDLIQSNGFVVAAQRDPFCETIARKLGKFLPKSRKL